MKKGRNSVALLILAVKIFVLGIAVISILVFVDSFLANREESSIEIMKIYPIASKRCISKEVLTVEGAGEFMTVYKIVTGEGYVIVGNPEIYEVDSGFRMEEQQRVYYKLFDNSKKIFLPSEGIVIKEKYNIGFRHCVLYIPKNSIE